MHRGAPHNILGRDDLAFGCTALLWLSSLHQGGSLALVGTCCMHSFKRETLTNMYICHCINLETGSGRAQHIVKGELSISAITKS